MRLRTGIVGLALLAAGCSNVASPGGAYGRLVDTMSGGRWRSTADDTFEVWVCHVPAGSTSPVYGGLPLRQELTPAHVAALVAHRATDYFVALSHGMYRPLFIAGGEVTMAIDDGPQECVDAAIAGASSAARAVLAVADAEHAPGRQGGFGDGGRLMSRAAPVRLTRRYAYVGAADFNPSWGDAPPMDLVEHEIGHTLGWIHSGTAVGPPASYLSALDVMSNSAAPREVDPTVRNAQDTLAVNRVIAGWLPEADVTVMPGGGTARLSPSTGPTGTRLLVLPVDRTSFLTVELLTADGFDAQLPHTGLAVHRVVIDSSGLESIEPLDDRPPYTALLRNGESLEANGWRVTAGPAGSVTAVGTLS